ncbi:hypothetical protein PC121_g6570 [Phytophthora cactorum]|nr:hypothetical protein PC121_g6570 [Phytophthora cactorum]
MQENVLPEDFPPSEKAPPNRVPVEKVTQKKPAQKKPAKASSKKATQRKASQKKVPQRKAPKKKATLKNFSQKKTIQKKMPLKKTSLSAAQAPVEFNGVASQEMEMLEESEELRSPMTRATPRCRMLLACRIRHKRLTTWKCHTDSANTRTQLTLNVKPWYCGWEWNQTELSTLASRLLEKEWCMELV